MRLVGADGGAVMGGESPRASGYWILFTHQECPACGGGRHDFQERIFDRPKPEKWEERHIFEHWYDHCFDCAGLYG